MCLLFIALNFIVSFIADLVLNLFSRSKYAPPTIRALNPYFKHYNSATLTAVYAGLTVVSVLLFTMVVSFFLFGFAEPLSLKQLGTFILLAFHIGYVADNLIFKYKIFGKTLDPFYKIAGAGFWGALSFVVAIFFAYFLVKLVKFF
jgi:hypothetical protein